MNFSIVKFRACYYFPGYLIPFLLINWALCDTWWKTVILVAGFSTIAYSSRSQGQLDVLEELQTKISPSGD